MSNASKRGPDKNFQNESKNQVRVEKKSLITNLKKYYHPTKTKSNSIMV